MRKDTLIQNDRTLSFYLTLHTNFEFTKKDVEQINKFPGVETAYKDGRYSISIRTGKLFDRQEVADRVTDYFKKKYIDVEVQNKQSQ